MQSSLAKHRRQHFKRIKLFVEGQFVEYNSVVLQCAVKCFLALHFDLRATSTDESRGLHWRDIILENDAFTRTEVLFWWTERGFKTCEA